MGLSEVRQGLTLIFCWWWALDKPPIIRHLITISMLNNFFTIGFRAKMALTGYRKSYPRNLKMFSNLTFDLNFKVELRPFCWFYSKNVCKSVPVVAIMFIFMPTPLKVGRHIAIAFSGILEFQNSALLPLPFRSITRSNLIVQLWYLAHM
jgi:hypothetical protein